MKKQTKGKPPFSRIPYEAIEACARVFNFGALKYEWDGYKKNPPTVLECNDALVRHAYKLANGEQFDVGPKDEFGETDDPETSMKWSGLHHVGHMLCCAAMMAWVIENRPDLNDSLSGEDLNRIAFNTFMSGGINSSTFKKAEVLPAGENVYVVSGQDIMAGSPVTISPVNGEAIETYYKYGDQSDQITASEDIEKGSFVNIDYEKRTMSKVEKAGS